ncbi:DNA polymerase-3 subunit gamma/tau [Lactobacillus colini]|uniref:DNA-directed DNA polymerase n=1 Tax=Lactobacillus colini TaxID=1819254 RepID=A0ABS4MFR1_9LACO|nr:DNA polymerase III subunit gamma/tau [Lactobacillus colini]MBP2058525.1 DNA polymerase-3 subunit gamma/tau [Lactobacillus colini]
MAYQALYRKWRPRSFDSVVGQAAITDTLKNAIKRGKISHAFLFAGPRGTGKTSCAKIFAKALNCTNLQDGEPCNKCENCLAADKGAMSDIIEIDAASNNGVDEIREIRDKVKYAPTQGKYKVYIIDEVHMLSMGAFNALLKTLEEPPEHVVFILATTELQKVPATIISRTQRYNFKRIDQQDLIARMEYILSQEEIKYEPEALRVIAQVADGGMRDSLSILDQILSYDLDVVKYQDALKITGFADQEKIEQLFLSLNKQDTEGALTQVKELIQAGASSKNILDELIELSVQGMLSIKGNQDHSYLVENYLEELKQLPSDNFFRLIKLANEALTDLRFTNQQAIPLDVFIVKMTSMQDHPEVKQADNLNNPDLTSLKKQLTLLEEKVATLANNAPKQVASSDFSGKIDQPHSPKEPVNIPQVSSAPKKPKHKAITDVAKENNRKKVYHVLENATKDDILAIKDTWNDVVSTFRPDQKALLGVLTPVAASPDQVVLSCKYEMWFQQAAADSQLVETIEAQIARMTKHNYGIVLVPADSWQQVRSDFVQSHKQELLAKKLKKLSQDPQDQESNDSKVSSDDKQKIIAKAQELFGDLAHIKD